MSFDEVSRTGEMDASKNASYFEAGVVCMLERV